MCKNGIYTAWYKQQGSLSLFFAALVLPLLFFLFALSVDITKYFRESQRAQKALDDAALYAYKFMPFQARASQAARSYLSQYHGLAEAVDIQVDADSITLVLNSHANLSFASYFMPEGVITMTAYAKARGTPFDTLLAIDSSNYLAPGLEEEAWGTPAEWPAADFFAAGQPYPCLKSGGGWVEARNLTQLCFNEAFSALKLSAIRAYQYLAGFRFNAVGVGFFPGSGGLLFDEVRPVQFGRSPVPDGGEAFFKNYVRYCGSCEYCAAAAQEEINHEAYKFPAANESIEGLWQPPPGEPQMILPPDWHFNPDYRSYLRASQAIWSRVALQELPRIDELLLEILLRIIPPLFPERGGLQLRPQKTAIIFAGDVPRLGTVRFAAPGDPVALAMAAQFEQFRTVLRENPDFSLKLFYVIVQHAHSLEQLPERFMELKGFLAAEEQLDPALGRRFELRALMASDAETLARTVAGEIILDKKSAVLSR